MNHADIVDIYPLTPTQEGLLFHTLLDPHSGVYIIQQHGIVEGEVDIKALSVAWDEVVQRQALLRTSFEWEGLERPLQVVHRQVHLPLVQEDWSELSAEQQNRKWRDLLAEDRRQGFDLHQAPLMRFVLVRLAAGSYRSLWSHHHVLADGWSLPLLLKEVFARYEADRQGRSLHLPQPRPFRDYIAWLEKQNQEQTAAFWRGLLAGFREPTRLGIDRPASGATSGATSGIGELRRQLSASQTRRLESFARQHQVTLNTLVQAAWALLLSRYGNSPDVVFGVTVSGRSAPLDGIESMIGPFINTLPVRVNLARQETVRACLARLQAAVATLQNYEYSPLVKVQKQSDLPPGTPLFEYLYVFENFPMDLSGAAAMGQSIKFRDLSLVDQTNYPLMLVAVPGQQLGFRLNYAQNRFALDELELFLAHLQRLLEEIPLNPDRRLGEIPLLTDGERRRLLVDNNATQTEYPSHKCIHQLFAEQVERTPDAVAVVAGELHLSYAELNARANRLAWHLIERGIGPGELVGVCAERSVELVLALYGILKAGGAYLPLDPEYPPQRLAEMLADARPTVLLTQQHLADRLPPSDVLVIRLDAQWEEVSRQSAANPVGRSHALDPAYAIYTSGSTGRPKGVLVPQTGVCNRLWWMQQEYQLTDRDRVLQKTPFTFDVSVWEFFWPLMFGARLVMARPGGHRDPDYLVGIIQQMQVTTAHFVPSMLQAFVEAEGVEQARSLSRVVCSGEALSPELVRRFHARSAAKLENLYGPTEASVDVTYWACPRGKPLRVVPIGRPLANTQVYLLDDSLHPVPASVPGDLYLGGVQLALGYLRRPGLTAERFVPHPCGDLPGQRLYQTGDLARWLPDGNLEFLGRIDQQVKIRGMRIELGEIETVLLRHKDVGEGVVMAFEDAPGHKRLVAYVVPRGDPPSIDSLRRHLGERLPDYMVPQNFVTLAALPLTSSGKVDRRALPAPESKRPEFAAAYVAPRNDTETKLASIWCEVLGVDRVGVHDNFFALGGHSLLGTQVISHVRQQFEVELPLRGLFAEPTVAHLALLLDDALRKAAVAKLPPIRRADRAGSLPLSFAQERLWFLDRLDPGSPLYNVPAAVRIRGKLDRAALVKSIETVFQRHEVLRTSFETVDGYPVQRIHDKLELPLSEVDLSGISAEQMESTVLHRAFEEAQKPFDLARGPLVRACVAQLAEDDCVLLWTMHHIASDGWSTGVVFREVAQSYLAYSNGREPDLSPLPVQYADYAVWQRTHLTGQVLDEQLDYWRRQLAGAPEALKLPTDRPRPAVQTYHGAHLAFELSEELTSELHAFSRAEGVTLFMTLLAAFQTLVGRFSGQAEVCVGTPIAGRNRAEIEPLIGFFVNTLVLRGDLRGTPSFRELLRRTREVTLDAYAHQDLPFERLVEELQTRRDLSRSPLVQVILSLQNAPLPSVELGDLSFTPIEPDTTTAKFDLTVALQESRGRITGRWRYNTDLFEPDTIAEMAACYRKLLAEAMHDPDRPVSGLMMLDETQRRQLLFQGHGTTAEFPADRCVHELFEAQVDRTPDAVAVVFQDEQMTYGELNRRANQLAHYLRGLGVSSEQLVGVCLERSTEMVIGLLGVLKAGGAYVPLDPQYPAQRQMIMLEDSRASVLITREPFSGAVDRSARRVVCLDADAKEIRCQSPRNPAATITPGTTAYVIYTSGSTGRPKGCVVAHANVTRLFAATQPWFRFSSRDVWSMFHSYAFDFSVWELWGALLHGGRLVVVPYGVSRTPEAFHELLIHQQITVLNQTPSAFQQLINVETGSNGQRPDGFKWVIFGGEALQPSNLRPWFDRYGDEAPRLVNMYGITETTVHVTYCPLSANGASPSVSSPIGRAIPDLRAYVLDSCFEPAPTGVAGEIHVGGAGVARGYLNDPALTAVKFVPDPFGDRGGTRLYRSGDQAHWRRDGQLEFLGRIDHQVKVRGFRIELAEIQAALLQHPAVGESVVLAREDQPGEKRLVAYVVSRGETPTIESLRGHLSTRLPEYMIPHVFVALAALPLTPNGKLDRGALPEPDGARPELVGQYVAPRTPIEEMLAKIFADVLKVERVGVHDDFFHLGGDSLTGAVLINRVQDRVGEIVYVVALFERPTVAGLADYLEEHYPHRLPAMLGATSEAASSTGLRARPTNEATVAPHRTLGSDDIAHIRQLVSSATNRDREQQGDDEKNPPAVFVLAPPRSGTTLLRVMLAGHSRLFAPPELELLSFSDLGQRRTAFSGSRKFWLEGTIRALMEIHGCNVDEAVQRMAAMEQAQLSTRRFYRLMQDSLQGRMLVDKTPSYALSVDTLERAERYFAGARYIHLLRHPQGMVGSFEKAHLDQIFFPSPHSYTPRELAELIWIVSHENITTFLESIPAERQYRLRFEDLVLEPEQLLRGVCEFLSVPFEDGLLSPYDDERRRMTDGPHRESRMLGDVRFRDHGVINRAVADAWRLEPELQPLSPAARQLAKAFDYQEPGRSSIPVKIERVDRGGPLQLSFSQERLWFLDQLVPNNPFYNMPGAVRLRGPLDRTALRRAFVEIIRRHETLRTTFATVSGRGVPEIAAQPTAQMPVVDLASLPDSAREQQASHLVRQSASRPFDLMAGPLVRAELLSLGHEDHILFWALHHIVSDGWSMRILVHEVTALYSRYAAGLPSPLPDLPVQYVDFARWQRTWLSGDVLETQLAYWRRQLADLPTLNLPSDRPRPAVQSFRGGSHTQVLPGKLTRSVKDLGRREGATLFITLLAGFQTLLARYSGQNDIVVGSPIAGRGHRDLEGLIGFFVNNLVLRSDLSGQPTFRECLARVRTVCLDAYAHQDLPYEKLVEELQPDRDLSRESLFQVVFALQNAPPPELRMSPQLTIAAVEAESEAARYDLEVHAWERDGELSLVWFYSTDLFDAATIQQLAGHFRQLLESVVVEPDRSVWQLSLLSDRQRQRLLAYNDSRAPDPAEQNVYEMFAEQARRAPDRVAVVYQQQQLSYGELAAQANQLARDLMDSDVGPETVVGLCVDRSPEMLIGVLGVVAAGGAFLPLDPAYPPARLESMLRIANARMVLWSGESSPEIAADLPGRRLSRIAVESTMAVGPRMIRAGHPEDLAYLIFTSGSTGVPKGVQLTQRGLRNLVESQIDSFGIDADSRVLQFASLSFDASVSEIFTALAAGATLILAADKDRMPSWELVKLLDDNCVTTATFPPSVLSLIPDHVHPNLSTVVSAGEACSSQLVDRWGAGRCFINAYGPTETTVCASLGRQDSDTLRHTAQAPHIGRPMRNMSCFVVDAELNLVPAGVYGELLIGGLGVARGYAGRADLTAERFIPNPFQGGPSGRLYRSGDLVRWRADGNLEFRGRADQQVKVRGFRVEIGEIEAAISQHPSVQQVVVQVAADEGGHHLAAAVVPSFASTSEDPASSVELWPSLAEYFVYDELLYYAMTHDERRNKSYQVALRKSVRDRVVLDIGTGGDAILARMCLEAGARKVYALEILEVSYRRARRTVEQLGLSDRITVLHADAMQVELPELVDVCVSEIVGPIGSMEGAVPILNDAWRRLVKDNGVMIPSRSVTRIAAARLPRVLSADPRFSPSAAHYVERIFHDRGGPFDLRICLKGMSASDLASEAGVFEDLDFTQPIPAEYTRDVELTVRSDGRIDGFLLWLQLHTCPGEVIDILDHEHCWQPVWFPVFPEGVSVRAGDVIRLACTTSMSANGLNPDYRIDGTLHRATAPPISFAYESLHDPQHFRGDAFYAGVFSEDGQVRTIDRVPSAAPSIHHEHVSQWRQLYDETARNRAASDDPTLNTVGWNSSYTGQPIPLPEMRSWVENTVARILELAPSKVLELGCGTGMLMFRIAPHCQRYLATDFSEPVVQQLRQRIAERDALSHVSIHCLEAGDLGTLSEENFDLVILNSVVQYFPSIEHLLDVLQQVVDRVRPGGSIFVGDVRNLDLLAAFHTSVQLEQASPQLQRSRLRQRVRNGMANDKELVIAPDFFRALRQYVPRVAGTEILLKRGRADNELTRFRYDVVIRIGATSNETTELEANNASRTRTMEWATAGRSLASIREQLVSDHDGRLCIRGIPNSRVWRDFQSSRWLLGETDSRAETAGAWSHARRDVPGGTVHPDDLFELADELGRQAVVEWSASGRPGEMDVTFLPRLESPRGRRGSAAQREAIDVARPVRDYANDPLWPTKARGLAVELRRHLAGRLPEYMIPSSISMTPSLPRLPSGKIDRKTLSFLEQVRGGAAGQVHVSPRTEIEKQLTDIWLSVLNVDRVGVFDNFFELGGHSLLATQVISRVRQHLEVELPLRELFEEPTVAHLARLVERDQQRGATAKLPLIARAERSGKLPLSYAQEQLWFLDQLQPGSPFYNIPVAVRIRGQLDRDPFLKSLERVIERHEVLRTTFETVDGHPQQRIRDAIQLPFHEIDLSGVAREEQEQAIRRWAAEQASQPFDLARGPLVRASLARVAAADHVFLWTMHHIVSDAWSMGVLLRELAEFFDALTVGREPRLPMLPVQYADFAAWQRTHLSSELFDKQRAYWKQQLAAAPQILDLPTDRDRPALPSFRGAVENFELSDELTGDLRALCRTEDTTPFMTLLAGFQTLLGRYSGAEQVLVGSPIAGRTRPELELLIGFFINTLVLRGDLTGRPTFRELLQRTREMTLGAYANQDLPFERLVEELHVPRHLNRNPLYQVMFALQNAPFPTVQIGQGLTFTAVDAETATAKFDLSLSMYESHGRLRGNLQYSSDLFDANRITRMIDHYRRILEAMVADPQQRVFDVPLTDPGAERFGTEPLIEELGDFDFAGLG